MDFQYLATLLSELLVFYRGVHPRLLVEFQVLRRGLEKADHILRQRLTMVTVEFLLKIIRILSDVCYFL